MHLPYHICALRVHHDVAMTKASEVSAFALRIPLSHLERVCKARALELDGKMLRRVWHTFVHAWDQCVPKDESCLWRYAL